MRSTVRTPLLRHRPSGWACLPMGWSWSFPFVANVWRARRPRRRRARHANRDGLAFDFRLQMLDGWTRASVQFVAHLPIQLHVDLLRFRRLHERRFGRRSDRGPRQGARPLTQAFGVRDTDLQDAVVWLGVFEDLDAAEQRSDVAKEDAARLALVPELSVHLDPRLERIAPEM